MRTIHACCCQDEDSGLVEWDLQDKIIAPMFHVFGNDPALAHSDIVLFTFDTDATDPDELTATADDMMANMPARADAAAITKALEDAGFGDFKIIDVRIGQED